MCFGNSSCVTTHSGDNPVFSTSIKSLQIHLLPKKKKKKKRVGGADRPLIKLSQSFRGEVIILKIEHGLLVDLIKGIRRRGASRMSPYVGWHKGLS